MVGLAPRSSPQNHGVWKKICGFTVPNKVKKKLLWRACKNSIPTKTNLVRRKVLMDDVCEHCKQLLEDAIHALWLCPCISVVWGSDQMQIFRSLKHFSRFVDVVRQVIEDEKNLEVFAMFVWTLWYHRNELVTSNKIYPITHVIPNAQLAGTEFI